MKLKKTMNILIILITTLLYTNCSNDDSSTSNSNPENSVPEVYEKIYGAIAEITSDGNFVTIRTNGMPDHKSPYYPTTNLLYEPYSGSTFGGGNFNQNPNVIAEQNFTFRIPINPTASSNNVATALGAIGVGINGVPLFNQYAGPNNQPLTNEINSFDKYYGHPTGSSIYHYHIEPLYLTTVTSSKSSLLGFLLDGFPVYGPEEENGTTVTSSDLDVFHGHTHSTIDFPNGTYHYHFTADAPYLNGNGYYGTPGTVTQ